MTSVAALAPPTVTATSKAAPAGSSSTSGRSSSSSMVGLGIRASTQGHCGGWVRWVLGAGALAGLDRAVKRLLVLSRGVARPLPAALSQAAAARPPLLQCLLSGSA